jgi:ribosome-associated protein
MPVASADEPRDGGAAPPSKSQRKRDMHALQDLGEALVALNRKQLGALDLAEPVLDAILFAQRVKTHEGRRRHLQYLGKLMRGIDPAPLRARLGELTGASRQAVARHHECERLRDALLADDTALTALLAEHPGADAQGLRATIRAARREREGELPPRHVRLLFQQVRALVAGTPVT